MGTVWRAADTLLRRDVAIKEVILPPGLAPSDRDAMYERTMREARAAAALQHPAVVQVYDVVHENGRPWIVMELLDARSLADMVIEDGPVAPRVVAKIGIALLGALEVAHAHGVLHRDVKPANVLICNDGRCVLTDFGVARMPTDVQLTTPGMVLGSPHFISPERAMGSEFGPPSDLFSLGVTLYTAVEGRPPFDKGDPIETMHAVVEDPPAPAVRAGSLTPVLMGLLEKDPAQRMDVQTARTLLRQQLAGPLASKMPPHMMTDPYSVVPAQRPAATPAETQPIPPQPPASGQIGGRAMLAPGESLTDHLAKLQQSNSGRGRRRRRRPDRGRGRRRAADRHDAGHLADRPDAGGGRVSRRRLDQRAPAPRGVERRPGRPRPDAGPGRQQLRRQARPGARQGRHGARAGTARLVSTVKGWPRKQQLIAGGGALAVLVVLIVVVLAGRRRQVADPAGRPDQLRARPPTPPSTPRTTRATTRSASRSRPAGHGAAARQLRRLHRPAEQAASRSACWWRRARSRRAGSPTPRPRPTLKKSKNCPQPFKHLGTTDVQVDGHAGAQFEYTCGTGDSERHGIWRMTTVDGKMYSFFLTAPQTEFAASKKYFDEMVNTFKLTA